MAVGCQGGKVNLSEATREAQNRRNPLRNALINMTLCFMKVDAARPPRARLPVLVEFHASARVSLPLPLEREASIL